MENYKISPDTRQDRMEWQSVWRITGQNCKASSMNNCNIRSDSRQDNNEWQSAWRITVV